MFLDGGAYYGPSPTRGLPSGRTVTHTGGGLSANSTENDHIETVTLTAGGRSYVLTRGVFDRAGRLTASATDNGALTTYTLDGAGRQVTTTDALGNVVQNTLDANGNVTGSTRIEKCTISDSIPAESFASTMKYDVLDRVVVLAQQGLDGVLNSTLNTCCVPPATPNQTIFTLFGYDSRNNRTNVVDPKGNTRAWDFDGASRLLRDLRHLRANGTGGNPVTHTVTTQTSFDANGNTIRLVDDNGGTTAWAYDPQDRQASMTFHDGSTRSYGYDPAADVAGYTDENGSVLANSFDVLGRKTAVTITRAAGVVGTTAQSFQFDGLSRLTFARDTADGTAADCGFIYDSLSRVLEEQQTYSGDARYVTHTAWTSYPSTGFTFPNGRQTTTGYDAVYRKNSVTETADASLIASWQFFGSRTATLTLGNGLVCSFMNNAGNRSAVQAGRATPGWGDIATDHLGYDGAGRPIGKRYFNGSSVLVGFTTAYDPSSSKLFERSLHAEGRASLYDSYDSMDRLLDYQRGTLASGGGSVSSSITLPGTNQRQSYSLDALGNWSTTTITPVGRTASVQSRTHNRLNQVTAHGVSPTSTPVYYDRGNNSGTPPQKGNGNVIDDGVRSCAFDAYNRLQTVSRKSDDLTVGQYVYDALSRRIQKAVSNGGVTGTVPNGTTRFLYVGERVIEEVFSSVSTMQYVWGQYIDELVQAKTYASGGPEPLAAGSYYLLSDLLYRSAALTDGAATIVEAYDTDAYGNTLLFKGSGADSVWYTNDDVQAANAACRYVFTGREFDAETRLYFYRSRYFDAGMGRFLGRDAIGYAGGPNVYEYVNDIPVSRLDPRGRKEVRQNLDPGDYWSQWIRDHGFVEGGDREQMMKTFQRGCVGITCPNLGVLEGQWPDMSNCYDTLPHAKARRDEMEKNCDCKDKKNSMGAPSTPRIFSIHFNGQPGGNYDPDPHTGQVTMVGNYDPWKSNGEFDYGWFVPGESGKADDERWLHAVSGGDRLQWQMLSSNTERWDRHHGYPLQVYCVACEDWKFTWSAGPHKGESHYGTKPKPKPAVRAPVRPAPPPTTRPADPPVIPGYHKEDGHWVKNGQ